MASGWAGRARTALLLSRRCYRRPLAGACPDWLLLVAGARGGSCVSACGARAASPMQLPLVLLLLSKQQGQLPSIHERTLCSAAEIVGRNWTYITPMAFKGGSWSAERRCVYSLQPAAPEASSVASFKFSKPPGCLHDGWTVARGSFSSSGGGTVRLAFDFFDPSGSLNRTETKVGRLTASCGVVGTAAHAFLDMDDGGMYVRGYGHGRDHPMDFAHHEWMRLAAAWVVRSAIIVFPDGTEHITPGIPVAPGALPHYDGQYLRDGAEATAHQCQFV